MTSEWATGVRQRSGISLGLLCLIACPLSSTLSQAASKTSVSGIELELSPRVCSLSSHDEQCDTVVRAKWSAPHEESLCLVIADRPDVKQCWEHYESGTYTVELMFAHDLTFELRDPALQRILASEVLRVIREAILYRHKRRQPWNIFD